MEIREIEQLETLHERASAAIDTLLARAIGSLSGVERTVVNQAAQLLYPRVQRKLREVTRAELEQELAYFRSLVNVVLQDECSRKPAQKRARRASRARPRSPGKGR